MTSVPQPDTTRPGTTASANEATAVPPGYKQTEVGVIPEDWGVACLSRFWNVTDCKHVTAKFVASGYPVASIKEAQSRFVDLTNAKQTTQQFYNLLTEGGRKPVTGDLLLSRNATVGEVAQVADWHPPFAMGQDVCLLRRKSHEFSPDFLQAIFHSSIIGNQLSDLMVGSTFKRANVQQIKSFVVPMPGPAEQRAIAEALSDVDQLLGSLEKLIAKKRAIKQTAMQQLLTGKTRLPGFKEDWETRRLENIAPLQRGFDLPTSQIRPGPYAVVYSNGVLHHHERSMVKGPGVVTGRSGTIGKVHFIEKDYWPHNTALWVTSFCGNDPKFIYYFYTHIDLTRFLSGSGVPTLNRNDVHQHLASCPPLPEQRTIATVLSDMDADIAALERRRDKARAIKQGMMQQLLTGRVRLVRPESDGKS